MMEKLSRIERRDQCAEYGHIFSDRVPHPIHKNLTIPAPIGTVVCMHCGRWDSVIENELPDDEASTWIERIERIAALKHDKNGRRAGQLRRAVAECDRWAVA